MRFNIKSLSTEIEAVILALVNGYSKQPLKYFLITSIVMLTVIKLNLIGTGFLSIPDESRYDFSGIALQNLSELKIGAAIDALFSTKGRPADAILKMIPNAIQYVTARIFNLNYYESDNTYPLFIFNFIIYCFILIVHFKFSKLVLKDSLLALISVLLFSSLINSYLYLRHALPYDASLLIFYLILYKIVSFTENDRLSFNKSFILGICSFLGLLIYPGYFPLFFISLFLLCFNKLTKKDISRKVFHSGCYIFGSAFCLAIFEVMSRLAGRSYIRDALSLSATITQGSFEECFTFIIKYLFEVEFLTGILLIISLALFSFAMVNQIIKKGFKQPSLILLLGIAVTGMFLAYASAGYFLHTMVFYGRLLHQYFPFICIFSLFSLNELIKNSKNKQLFSTALSIVFIVNFGINFVHYHSFSYPRDIAWEVINMNNVKGIEYDYEYDNVWQEMPEEKESKKIGNTAKSDNQLHNYLLVNCTLFYPVNDLTNYHIFYPKDNYVLVKSKPLFLNFKAYQYEGYGIVERRNLDKMNLQIKLFSTRDIRLN